LQLVKTPPYPKAGGGTALLAPAMKDKKASIGFIFVTVLISVIGLGIIIPVMPELIAELTGGSNSQASRYGGGLLFVYAFFQFLFSPILGGLSDRYGRRPVLLFSLFGLGMDYLVLAFAPTIGWLFLGRTIAGVCGASFTTASAYVADISEPDKRSQNFGLMGAAFGLGFTIGPVVGGLLGEYGSRMPFFASAGLALLNGLYGYFILPESLSKENRRPFDLKRANPVGTLLHLRKYPVILGLVISLFFIYLAQHASHSTWAYFTIEKFDWSKAQVGYSLGFVGLMIIIVQGGVIRPVIKAFGQEKTAYIGLLFYVLGMFLIGIASAPWMIYAFMVPYAIGGLAGPALQGIMTGQVSPKEQGELQGGLTSLMSVSSIIGPPLMTGVFSFFTGVNTPFYFPGAPFILGTFFALVSVAISIKALNNP